MRAILLSLAVAAVPATATAQEFDFYAHGPYRQDVPRPSRLLGYEPGAYHTDYGNMLRVIDAIAGAASDRVRVFEYGKSVEGRPLILLAISAPENMARLDEIQSGIRELRDPRATSRTQVAAIAESTPAIAWMNYANDGNESAALEAALHVTYQLAAGRDSLTRAILENLVTVITPAHNPESHARFVAWYNAVAVGDSAHAALEHAAPWWMDTNNNHYQIDLNRDALGITQRETRGLVAAFHEWSPQVFVDHHGQTTQYYFPPPMLPINPSLHREQILKWTDVYGRANAASFDRYGWNYYVRDVFDLHYPGYWDSWPALNGATGMTYETDGGGYRGYRWRRDDGTVVTFRGGIARHVTASLATLGATAEHRQERLRDYHQFFRSAMNDLARERRWKRFVIVPGDDPERAARLVEVLLRNGIEVGIASSGFETSAHDYLTGVARDRQLPAGSYVIDLAQPQARLVDALLAPESPQDEEFIREQLRRRAVNARRGDKEPREWYEFYDITGWALPISFGVQAYWLEGAPTLDVEPLSVEFDPAAEPWAPPASLGPREVADLPERLRAGIEGGVRGAAARTAYVFRYDRNASARLAIALMQEGFNVAVAAGPLRAGGAAYPRGSMVLRVSRNPDSLHERIAPLAGRFGVPVDAVNTAYTEEGPTGVGSEPVVTLRRPRVALVGGAPVSTRGYGHTWYTLARELGLGSTGLWADRLRDLDLRNYDVIILPPGSPRAYERAFGESGADALKEWVRAGGVLMGIAGGAEYLAREDLELTTARPIGTEEAPEEESEEEPEAPSEDELPPTRGTTVPPLVSVTGGEDRPLPVPGTMMRAALDLTHPLTFGYEAESIAVLVSGDDLYRPSEEGSNPVAFVGDDLVVSGYAWPDNTEKFLRGSAWMVDEPLGRGRVVLFADDPNYRLIWPSLTRLFLNPILLGPTVRGAVSVY